MASPLCVPSSDPTGPSAQMELARYRAASNAVSVLRLHGFAADRSHGNALVHVVVAHYFGAVRYGRPLTATYRAALAVIDRAEAFGLVLAHDQATEIVARVLEPYFAAFPDHADARPVVSLTIAPAHA